MRRRITREDLRLTFVVFLAGGDVGLVLRRLVSMHHDRRAAFLAFDLDGLAGDFLVGDRVLRLARLARYLHRLLSFPPPVCGKWRATTILMPTVRGPVLSGFVVPGNKA
jgi:hypothetical protein